MKKKLYLANPYGFSKQIKSLLQEFTNIFKDLNIDVYEPFERTKYMMQKEGDWAYDLAKSNFYDLKKCDGIFAIVNGTPPDEGVMIELGIAIALKKKSFYLEMILGTALIAINTHLILCYFLVFPETIGRNIISNH